MGGGLSVSASIEAIDSDIAVNSINFPSILFTDATLMHAETQGTAQRLPSLGSGTKFRKQRKYPAT